MGIAADVEKINAGQDTDEHKARVIQAKIKVKEVEYENNNTWIPTILIIIGLVGLIWIYGIILIIIGVFWSWHCTSARTKAIAEIDELETQLAQS